MAQAANVVVLPKGNKSHPKKKGLRAKGIKPKEKVSKGKKPNGKTTQVEVKKTRTFHPPTKEGTIAFTIWSAIEADKLTNNEILDKVKKDHKGCNTTYACVAWYRSKKRALEA